MDQPKKNGARRSLRRGERGSHASKKASRSSFIQTGGFDKGYRINTTYLNMPAADRQITVTLGDWKTDYAFSYRQKPETNILADLKRVIGERAAHFGLEYPPKVKPHSVSADGLPKRLDEHAVRLPLHDNQGVSFPLILLADTILEIITTFGGASSDKYLGAWPDDDSLYIDPGIRIAVWTDDSEGLVRYAGTLAHRFRQLSIAVTQSPQTVWFVPPSPSSDSAHRGEE